MGGGGGGVGGRGGRVVVLFAVDVWEAGVGCRAGECEEVVGV